MTRHAVKAEIKRRKKDAFLTVLFLYKERPNDHEKLAQAWKEYFDAKIELQELK